MLSCAMFAFISCLSDCIYLGKLHLNENINFLFRFGKETLIFRRLMCCYFWLLLHGYSIFWAIRFKFAEFNFGFLMLLASLLCTSFTRNYTMSVRVAGKIFATSSSGDSNQPG